MSATTTEEFRVRVRRDLVRNAKAVAKEMGTTPGDIVRMMFVQLVKRRTIPFPVDADSPESEILGSTERRRKLWDEIDEGKPAAR